MVVSDNSLILYICYTAIIYSMIMMRIDFFYFFASIYA